MLLEIFSYFYWNNILNVFTCDGVFLQSITVSSVNRWNQTVSCLFMLNLIFLSWSRLCVSGSGWNTCSSRLDCNLWALLLSDQNRIWCESRCLFLQTVWICSLLTGWAAEQNRESPTVCGLFCAPGGSRCVCVCVCVCSIQCLFGFIYPDTNTHTHTHTLAHKHTHTCCRPTPCCCQLLSLCSSLLKGTLTPAVWHFLWFELSN